MPRKSSKKYEDYVKEITTEQPIIAQPEPEPKSELDPVLESKIESPKEPEPEKKEYKYMPEKIEKPEKEPKPEKTIHLNKISIECGGFRVAIESPDQDVEKVAGLGKDIIKELTGLTTPPSDTFRPETAQEIEDLPEGIVTDTVPEQDEYQRLIEKVKGENKK